MISVDESTWPLVVVTFEGAASAAAFDGFLATMESYLRRRARHGYLLDARAGAMIGAEQRAAQGAWLKRYKVELQRYSVGSALVIRSAAVRFALTAIYLVQPPVVATEAFGEIEPARAWITERLTREGLRIPRKADP